MKLLVIRNHLKAHAALLTFLLKHKFNIKTEMKKIIITSALLAAAVVSNAAPLVTIGDQLDLFFKGAVVGKWDSNITYSSDSGTAPGSRKYNDFSTIIRLGAEADYGRNSKFKANVKFYEDLTRYADYKEFNSNLAHVAATASYTETVFSVKANFSFNQNFQNSSTTTAAMLAGELVRSNAWNANLTGSYDFSDKIFGELGGNWMYNEYLGKWASLYSDYNVFGIPVSVLYRVTPKISVGLTYQYRYTTFSGGDYLSTLLYGDTRDDHFGGVTLRGDILPKLAASIYAGVTYREMNNALIESDADTTFALGANLSYELTEKVVLFANGRRDFGNGASRQSSIDSGCEVGANYFLNQFISLVTSFAYTNSEYMGMDRNDNEYIGRIGVSYSPNKFIKIATNYRFLDNSSNVSSACYNQHVVDISVSLKY